VTNSFIHRFSLLALHAHVHLLLTLHTEK